MIASVGASMMTMIVKHVSSVLAEIFASASGQKTLGVAMTDNVSDRPAGVLWIFSSKESCIESWAPNKNWLLSVVCISRQLPARLVQIFVCRDNWQQWDGERQELVEGKGFIMMVSQVRVSTAEKRPHGSFSVRSPSHTQQARLHFLGNGFEEGTVVC